MANWNRWGLATGLAAALAIFGTAQAADSSASGKVDKKLEESVQKIHAANQAEVHMGKMAQQQATSDEVKQFGQKLEQDHRSLDEKLTQAAQSAGISLEGKGAQDEQKDAQKMMEKLQGKTGQDFDKAFVSAMVKDHEKDIKETQKAAKEAKAQKQTELAALLDKAVTGMQGHLATAKQLEKTVGKGKSASSSSSTPAGSSGASDTSSGASGSSSSGMSGSSGSSSGNGSWKNDSSATSGSSGTTTESHDAHGSKTGATKSSSPSGQ